MSLFLLAVALAMDAFAAALSQGATLRSGPVLRRALVVGVAFGAAQGLMPLIGWSLGKASAAIWRDVDHWVAFVLLVLIGAHMIREGATGGRAEHEGASRPSLFMMAIATSIDAAVAGATFASLGHSIAVACAVIGVITFVLSGAGVFLGKTAGDALGARAQVLGGLVLIALGIKIVIAHLYFGG